MLPFEVFSLSAFVAISAAVPLSQHGLLPASQHHLALHTASRYKCFDGERSKYPQADDWHSFEALWKINQPFILSRNGGDTYVEHYIHEAIIDVSVEKEVDPRFVLAAVMQVVW